MKLLYDRVLPLEWNLRSGEPAVWADFENVTPGELWETHQALKNRMILFARNRMLRRAERLGLPASETTDIHNCLDPEALTIGFARRFAPYKRADLVLRDIELLGQIVADSKRPVQFVFAGKSHPADNNGKAILQRIFKLTQEPGFKGKIVLLEDYDINVARHLVQAFDGRNGFTIGNGRNHTDQDVQDDRDAKSLMRVLHEEVIPLFFDRDDDDGLPQAWIARMKRSVRTLGWRFNADRMVMDYVEKAYIPAAGGLSSDMGRLP